MFVIHAGLHKTGSTAIQRSFAGTQSDLFHYLGWRRANHSDLSVLLFAQAPEKYWVFQREGRTKDEMQAWRKKAMARVQRDFETNRGKTHIFSAEQLAKATPEAVARMQAFFAPFADPFKVIIYVRPAQSYMESMAQQRIRTGSTDIKLIWPDYRASIEKFDQVFGEKAVEVRQYNPDAIQGWDAVSDFSEAIGVRLPVDQQFLVNTAMGARHAALVLDRRAGLGGPPHGTKAVRADQEFLASVLPQQSPPFRLDPAGLDAKVANHSDDLAWIKDRLGGVSMDQSLVRRSQDVVFSSTQDALDYARECMAPRSQLLPGGRAREFAGRIKRRILRGLSM